jgi:hypothetical protein
MTAADCTGNTRGLHHFAHVCYAHPEFLCCCQCGLHGDLYDPDYHELDTKTGDGFRCGPVGSIKPRTAREMLVDAGRRSVPWWAR